MMFKIPKREVKAERVSKEYTNYERNIIATGWFVIKACFGIGIMVSIWIVLLRW